MRKPVAHLIKRMTLVKCKEFGLKPDKGVYRRLKRAYHSIPWNQRHRVSELILKNAII